MANNYNYFELLDIYEKSISKRVENKRNLIKIESNKISYIYNLYHKLQNNNYQFYKYNIFLIKEHKYRIIIAPSISDKIINHYLMNKFLLKKLEINLDKRNIATRKKMGTDYGIKLIKRYYEIYKKYDIFYILKIDLKKYFYSIDHNVLKKLLITKLDRYEYKIISHIVDSSNNNYINKSIKDIKNKYLTNQEILKIPYYLEGKGLAIGLVANQLLAIFYLDNLHKFINRNLKIKHFIAYMDDIVIFHKDRKYLKYCLMEIEKYLNTNLKLELNKDKVKIVNCFEELEFLGYNFKIVGKKTIIKIKNKALKKIKRKIKETKYLYDNNKISLEKAFNIINNYQYGYKYINNKKIKYLINKYWKGKTCQK